MLTLYLWVWTLLHKADHVFGGLSLRNILIVDVEGEFVDHLSIKGNIKDIISDSDTVGRFMQVVLSTWRDDWRI